MKKNMIPRALTSWRICRSATSGTRGDTASFFTRCGELFGKFVAGRGGLPAMIDLGGGCGGWVQYLAAHPPQVSSETGAG